MELLGNSIQIKEINEIIRQVAPTNISVLITGESGTGKEVVANCIHEYSKRKGRPFITVNCGAIPEGIIESELFGHQKGAFTGAIDNREGYFEMAAKGTIFLDEIGDMPLATQVKILRVLESGEFLRVGGNRNIHVDVRVVAATNKNLSQEVINKNFREDLYFRLRLVNIHIPPLRERKSDVKVLFEHFINEVCRKNGIAYRGIEDDAMEFLINYVWYGNARELKNFCESIVVLNPNKKLALADVKKNLHSEYTQPRQLPAVPLMTKDYSEKDLIMRALFELKSDILDIKKLLKYKDNEINSIQSDSDFFINRDRIKNMDDEEIDKEILVYLLRLHDWDVKKVSDNLNQTPRNVYRKIKKYNIIKNF